jgi:hypothetical protein
VCGSLSHTGPLPPVPHGLASASGKHDRAALLRQFVALPRDRQLGFLCTALEAHAAGMTVNGMVIDRMCQSLADADRVLAVHLEG